MEKYLLDTFINQQNPMRKMLQNGNDMMEELNEEMWKL